MTDEMNLNCVGCGSENTHQYKVEVFNREQEDGASGNHVIVRGAHIHADRVAGLKDNPSPRRDGACLYLSCEQCDDITKVAIYQHKGATYLRTERVVPISELMTKTLAYPRPGGCEYNDGNPLRHDGWSDVPMTKVYTGVTFDRANLKFVSKSESSGVETKRE